MIADTQIPELKSEVDIVSVPMTSATLFNQIQATGTAEVIVVLKTPAASSSGRTAGRALSAADLEKYFVPSERSQILASLTKASLSMRTSARFRANTSAEPLMRQFPALGVVLGTVNAQGLLGLQKDPQIASVTAAPTFSLVRPVRPAATVRLKDLGSGARLLGAPQLWKAGFRGKDVVIAHLDTGVDASHPVLKGAISGFAEFDLNGNEVRGAHPHDTEEHGTHTAAIIVGRTYRGAFVGVAPEAKLVSALVIEGGKILARVLNGLNWAVNQGAKVLSMSLGIPGYRPEFLPIVQILRARGVLPVIAVGNDGPGMSRSPGNYAEALSVGACDNNKEIADFSSSETFIRQNDPLVPDLVGPGVDIVSAVPNGHFMRMSGTSMATPHIAGLAALLMQAAPGATIDQIE